MLNEWMLVAAFSMVTAQTPITFEGHENVISSLQFTSNGHLLASASWDKTVRIWDLKEKTVRHRLDGHRDWVHDLLITKDDKWIFSSTQFGMHTWDLKSAAEVNKQAQFGGATVNCVAVGDEGGLAITGGRNGFVEVWKSGQPKPLLRIGGFKSWVSALAIAPNSKQFATGTRTGEIRIFDLPSGEERAKIDAFPNRQVLALAISPDGKTLASGAYTQTAILWDTSDGKEASKLTGHRGVVTALAWSDDGTYLATGERHGSILLWNMRDNDRLVKKIVAHTDGRLGFSVTALAFSRDNKRLASGSYDKVVKVWEIAED